MPAITARGNQLRRRRHLCLRPDHRDQSARLLPGHPRGEEGDPVGRRHRRYRFDRRHSGPGQQPGLQRVQARADRVDPFGRRVPLAAKGVRINAILPGGVNTPLNFGEMIDSYVPPDELKMPAYRGYGESQHIAEFALYLASPRASFINGSAQVVDGGLTASFAAGASSRYEKADCDHQAVASASWNLCHDRRRLARRRGATSHRGRLRRDRRDPPADELPRTR